MSAARTPTPDEMRSAAEWLEQNEGEQDERAPMLVVAEWLLARADATELRAECRKAGLPVSRVRAALKAAKGEA